MTRRSSLGAFGLALLALVCWLVMFAAGTDVWHDIGRPDIAARLAERGATFFDMRAFAYAFYALFFVLTAHVVVTGAGLARRRP